MTNMDGQKERVERAIGFFQGDFQGTLKKSLQSVGAREIELWGLTVKFDPEERKDPVSGQDLLPLCRISVFFLLPDTSRLARSFGQMPQTWKEREMDPQSQGLRHRCFYHDLDPVDVDSRAPGCKAYIQKLFSGIAREFAALPPPQSPLPGCQKVRIYRFFRPGQ
ncbi:MAG: hypothetical protein M3O22_02715 [Pseudomonadota bacterium]|nr:hypothetical protein [Pseudomonadota bacterium]